MAWGRAKLTFEQGKLTTTQGSYIAFTYTGKWQLSAFDPPDEFEDAGQGEQVQVDPLEGGLIRYMDQDAWPATTLVVQLDPNDPKAGRFVFSKDTESMYWAETPGRLSVGADGMTHLSFDGDGFRRKDTAVGFDEGDIFEPLDDQTARPDPDRISVVEHFSLDITFRDGGKVAAGTIITAYGTQRFALGLRTPGPDKQFERAFAALKSEDWQALDKLLLNRGEIATVVKQFPKSLDFSTAQLSPDTSWQLGGSTANRRGYIRAADGSYMGFQLQAQWSPEDKTWWMFVMTDGFSLNLSPFVCVQRELDDSITAYFGYTNDLGGTVSIPVGLANKISPVGSAVPVTTFEPGQHPRAFAVKLSPGGTARWLLNGGEATATTRSPRPPVGKNTGSSADQPCP